MSRQELAEAVNAHLFATTERVFSLDARYVAKLERGEHRWPSAANRQAFRAVLGASTDADLGFYIVRRTSGDDDPALNDGPAPLGHWEPVAEIRGAGPAMPALAVSPIQVIVSPGAVVMVVCGESNLSGMTILAEQMQALVGMRATGGAEVVAAGGVAGPSTAAHGGARVYSLSDRRRAAVSRHIGSAAGPGGIA